MKGIVYVKVKEVALRLRPSFSCYFVSNGCDCASDFGWTLWK